MTNLIVFCSECGKPYPDVGQMEFLCSLIIKEESPPWPESFENLHDYCKCDSEQSKDV